MQVSSVFSSANNSCSVLNTYTTCLYDVTNSLLRKTEAYIIFYLLQVLLLSVACRCDRKCILISKLRRLIISGPHPRRINPGPTLTFLGQRIHAQRTRLQVVTQRCVVCWRFAVDRTRRDLKGRVLGNQINASR